MPQQPHNTSIFQPKKVLNFTAPANKTDPIELLQSSSYVDKTNLYTMLIPSNSKVTFIRPRGFGKTVMLNCLKLIFKGITSKKYFKGTYIYDQPWINSEGTYINKKGYAIYDEGAAAVQMRTKYTWPKYPVIFFDFKSIANKDSKVSKQRMINSIYNTACEYGIADKLQQPEDVKNMSIYLGRLFNNLTSLGNGYEEEVVVLIDEYDAVFRDVNFDSELQKRDMIDLMKDFYNHLKARSAEIKMKLITGTTAMSFIWATDITDISFMPEYATLVGFTKHEIETIFDYSMFEKLAASITKNGNIHLTTSKEAIVNIVMDKLEEWYSGYRFSRAEETVYNTLSVIESFNKSDITNHMMKRLNSEVNYKEILKSTDICNRIQVNEQISNVKEYDLFISLPTIYFPRKGAVAVLYQTGLLSIKSKDSFNHNRSYSLYFPNRETKENCENNLIEIYTDKLRNLKIEEKNKAKSYFSNGQWYEFFTGVRRVYAGLIADEGIFPYEKMFGILFTAILRTYSIGIQAHTKTEDGDNVDGFIETDQFIYIFGYKQSHLPYEYMDNYEGIKQLFDIYYYKLRDSGKPTYLIGINFQKSYVKKEVPGENEEIRIKRVQELTFNDKDLPNIKNIDNFVVMKLDKDRKKLSYFEGRFGKSKQLILVEYNISTNEIISERKK